MWPTTALNETSIKKEWVNVTDIYQKYPIPPACKQWPGFQTYRHWYHDAPWPLPNLTLPNSKDAFVNPADSTMDNISGVEETSYAALMNLEFNQMDADFNDVLAVCGLAIMQMQQTTPNTGQVMTAGIQLKDEEDKISEEEQEAEKEETIELSIMAALTMLPFIGRVATEIWTSGRWPRSATTSSRTPLSLARGSKNRTIA
ncbi:hypothetical protein PG996_012570 [Apiospora saccharicola]|uniref:Uncharacterized protein n=1 Tax=Apiospora saccharicola TaxID=335842 RepID=A0ABR1U5S5_9PEZI